MLSTGFSTYGLEVMSRLHKTGKFELAEFASYGGMEVNGENRYHKLPWKYYPNMPSNQEESKIYDSSPTNQWGEWLFNKVLLDFKPDIVWDIRDWWMMEYQERSPFRKMYKWIIMPTVDAMPQADQWISTFRNANGVFTYSDWGKEILQQQGVAVDGTAPPGVNYKSYQYVKDNTEQRKGLGIRPDAYIIGTVMRNQRRKLYPDLIESFSGFLKSAKKEVADKSYLYLHCAYPDIGWDIPKLIKDAGVASRTLFTYSCKTCGQVFPAFYQDVVGTCRYCGANTAILPRAQEGISTDMLGKIISCFDAYIQYSYCEGFGMPQVEAAACGVPVFAVDYSAMSDVVRKIEGFPIKVQRLIRESESLCYRAYPDNQDLINNLIDFFNVSAQHRQYWRMKTRKAVERNYSWDITAKTWETYFENLPVDNQQKTWYSPPRIFNPTQMPPDGLTNEEFVNWSILNIAGRPDLTNSYTALKLIRDLNWGVYEESGSNNYFSDSSSLGIKGRVREFTRKDIANILFKLCEYNNFWETKRCSVQTA